MDAERLGGGLRRIADAVYEKGCGIGIKIGKISGRND